MRKCPILILAAVLLLALAPVSSGANKLQFGTATRLSPPYYLPFLSAEENGLWKQQALEVEWIPFRGGGAADRALAAGSIQAIMSTSPTIFMGRAAGSRNLIVAELHPIDLFFIWVPSRSQAKQASDLKGAKVATSGLGGFTHTIGRALFRSLRMEKDIKWVGTGGIQETMAALKTGAVEASLSALYLVVQLKVKGEIKELIKVNDYLPRDWVQHVVVSDERFVKSDPDAMRRLLKALLQATDFINKNPAWTLERMKKTSGFSEEAARLVLEGIKFSTDGKANRKGLENVRNLLIEYGLIPKEKAPSVEEIYRPEFLS